MSSIFIVKCLNGHGSGRRTEKYCTSGAKMDEGPGMVAEETI